LHPLQDNYDEYDQNICHHKVVENLRRKSWFMKKKREKIDRIYMSFSVRSRGRGGSGKEFDPTSTAYP
jgi:hypothetical protein